MQPCVFGQILLLIFTVAVMHSNYNAFCGVMPFDLPSASICAMPFLIIAYWSLIFSKYCKLLRIIYLYTLFLIFVVYHSTHTNNHNMELIVVSVRYYISYIA